MADRRVVWGAVGAGAVIVAILMWSSNDAAAPPAANPTTPRPGAATAKAGADQSAPGVNLEALRAGRDEPVDQGRNPFRFRPKPAPPAPVNSAPPPTLFPGASNQSASGPVAEPVPTGPPPPPPIQLKLIGIVKQGNKTVAVLSDGQSPAFGVEGGMILGRYRLLKVSADSVEIAYEDGRGRTTLRLPPQ